MPLHSPEDFMDEQSARVAVITGAASGIGRALAFELARRGYRLGLADLRGDELQRLEAELEAPEGRLACIATDVSRSADVAALAEHVYARFGRVDILFNNAGVAGGRPLWEYSDDDWAWQIGVNLLGVAHGVRAFVPRMMAQETECHVVNTASAAGLVSAPGMGAYNATKSAVVSLSETLFHELAARSSRIRVSVLCPAWVRTNIWRSEAYRPARFRQGTAPAALPESSNPAYRRAVRDSGLPAEAFAERVLAELARGRFFIVFPDEVAGAFVERARRVKEGLPPFNPVAAHKESPAAVTAVDGPPRNETNGEAS